MRKLLLAVDAPGLPVVVSLAANVGRGDEQIARDLGLAPAAILEVFTARASGAGELDLGRARGVPAELTRLDLQGELIAAHPLARPLGVLARVVVIHDHRSIRGQVALQPQRLEGDDHLLIVLDAPALLARAVERTGHHLGPLGADTVGVLAVRVDRARVAPVIDAARLDTDVVLAAVWPREVEGRGPVSGIHAGGSSR